MREAVNYAIDRRRVVQIYGGPLHAVATCQVLMPGFPGYQRDCPYVDANGLPNLTRARQLVAASGTKGMTVGIWAAHFRSPGPRPLPRHRAHRPRLSRTGPHRFPPDTR